MSAPYAGNPANYPSSIAIPDGSDLPSSTVFAVPWEGLADRTAYLGQRVLALPAVNWRGIGGPGGAFSTRSAYYDPATGLWLIGSLLTGTGPKIQFGHGADPSDWTDLQSASLTGTVVSWVDCIATDPSGSPFYVGVADGTAPTGLQIQSIPPPSFSGWGAVTTRPSATGGKMLPFKTLVIVGVAHGTSGTLGKLVANAYTGTLAAGVSVPEWLLSHNGGSTPAAATLAVAIMWGTVSSSYWTSTDGSTWTLRTFAGSVVNVGNGDSPSALTYGRDPNGAAWYLAVLDGSTALTRVYRSPDALTWTRQSTVNDINLRCSDLVATGNTLLWLNSDTGSPWPQSSAPGVSVMLFSLDGALTWRRAPMALTGTRHLIPPQGRPRFASSPLQLCAYTDNQICFGLSSGIQPFTVPVI